MAKQDRSFEIYVTGKGNLEQAIKTALQGKVVQSYKVHNGILSLSTLASEGNGWELLDFYANVTQLEKFLVEWIEESIDPYGFMRNVGDKLVTRDNQVITPGYTLYNDSYLAQHQDFYAERSQLVLNRHIVLRVEPRVFED